MYVANCPSTDVSMLSSDSSGKSYKYYTGINKYNTKLKVLCVLQLVN